MHCESCGGRIAGINPLILALFSILMCVFIFIGMSTKSMDPVMGGLALLSFGGVGHDFCLWRTNKQGETLAGVVIFLFMCY